MNLISRSCLLSLPRFSDQRGSLTALEHPAQIPFPLRRIYYIYDIPYGAERAGHAVRQTEQVFIALSGSFEVLIDDGNQRQSLTLNRPDQGLFLGSMIWREITKIASGSICLALASTPYQPENYFHDYESFRRALAHEKEV